jgi:cytochrome c oxidase subunit 3
MSGSLTDDIIKGPPQPPIDSGDGGGGDGSESGGRGADRRASFIGLFVLLAATFMVFAALTIAFVMRRDIAYDWHSMHKPAVLWVNTGILLLSSIVLDRSRYALKHGDRSRFNFWWTGATALGVMFLLGQGYAWRELWQAGVFIASNPSSAFFYVLTAVHGAHILGGMAALVYVDIQAWRLRLGPAKRTAIDVTAVFWHFLDAMWLYLMLLFYVWG